jgi:hypothetical protein
MQACKDDLLHFASEPPNVVNVRNCELWLLEDGKIDVRSHNPATGMRHTGSRSNNQFDSEGGVFDGRHDDDRFRSEWYRESAS